jgi:hypothetical protein
MLRVKAWWLHAGTIGPTARDQQRGVCAVQFAVQGHTPNVTLGSAAARRNMEGCG